MNAVVIEHVPVADLPESWRARLSQSDNALVTVRIEAEPQLVEASADDPLFGMWRDREDMADVASHVRQMRAPRFGSDTPRGDAD